MTADSLNSLKTEREAISGQLHRFKQFLDDFRADKKSVAILHHRLLTASNLLQLFHRVQTKIEVIKKGAEPKDRAVFEELYYELLARAQLTLLSIKEGKCDVIPFEPQENINFVSCVKYPDYNGCGFETNNSWNRITDFQNISKISIPYKKTSSKFNKLNHFESCLNSDSHHVLKSIAERENYNRTSFLLMKKNVDDRSLVNGHIKAIYDLPAMESGSYSCMKKLYASLKEHIDALQTLGQDLDMWNILIINIVEQKLDPVTREDWKKIRVDQNTSLDMFTKYLADRCRYFELKNAANQEDSSVYYEEYNEKSNLLLSSPKYSQNQSKTDYGSKEKKETEEDKNSDSEDDGKKKKDKKKTKKVVQGGVIKVCMYGLHSFITSISKKMFKVLAKSVFKFFVKAYLKWQVVTPMSIQLV